MDVTVLWHDIECGAYTADLPLWRELAEAAGGAVLDLGAGTGRVALDLAARGHEVWALDRDGALLAALADRAGDLPVHTVHADARDFSLGRRFDLVVAPMQTLQLLGGPQGRARCLAAVARHLAAGGRFAAALACDVVVFSAEEGPAEGLPLPDMREVAGTVYASRPTAVLEEGDGFVLRRRREVVDPGGTRTVTDDVVRLDRLTPRRLVAEAQAAGLQPEAARRVPATDDHVASEVVVLRG